ncbi:hypothetical protein B6S12_07550 [Helicobacter valdiviensis]|uniref:YopX protein domain-containing protein n=1 Tax=Helicobacter valdiviensis TaxID=1458358 RepID=A0A2W6MTA4_9HELI|nr:YopX family protein [Helicobacter valdiviensis]PZT47707.1 hypothetical protein B6S12_07550 [Helicobacter valdiviensis]
MKLKDFDFRIWDGSKEEYIKKETKNSNKYSIVHDDIGYAVGLIGDAKNVYTIESGVTSHEWGYDDYEMVENYCIDESVCEIELWTGLKDRFGKKIYEGDIVKLKGESNCFVHYSNIKAKFGLYIDNGLLFEIESFYFKNKDDYEVIGNIHENAELLG